MKQFYNAAAKILAPAIDMEVSEVEGLLLLPPKPELGDIGFPCFSLAKKLRNAPPKIAAEVVEKLEAVEPFAEINPVGPYINFVLSQKALTKASVLSALHEEWGESNDGAGKTVVLEYSSPNIAKPLGVHHIRSTMLGAALGRLYKATGWNVITINYLGDWGTNFGQLMVAYNAALEAGENPKTDIDSQLKLYIKYHELKDSDPAFEDEARKWFKKLEDGDEQTVQLWTIFRNESIKGLEKLYTRLNVTFDHYNGESFYKDKMASTVDRINEKGILEESQGALVVNLEESEGIKEPCLIEKSDGATTYATRDLSAAEYRHSEYSFQKSLYVVANQQELHFRQIFGVLKRMGYNWANGCEHIKFGMLSFGAGVFGEERTTGSTRKGNVIFLEDVLNRSVEKAREIISENARDEKVKAEIDKLSEAVGVGAIIFTEFMQRRTKDVVFTWDKALNMQGESGPYLQYTHARLSSVITKAGIDTTGADLTKLSSRLERNLMLKLGDFPTVIKTSTKENEPSMIAEYLLDLCSEFNRMYADKHNHQIITEDNELSAARVQLVEATRNTLAKGLALLGLKAPTRM